MDTATSVLVGVLMAFFTGIQLWINKGRFDSLERRIEHHDRRFDQLSSEIAAVRSDLTQIALAIGRPSQTS